MQATRPVSGGVLYDCMIGGSHAAFTVAWHTLHPGDKEPTIRHSKRTFERTHAPSAHAAAKHSAGQLRPNPLCSQDVWSQSVVAEDQHFETADEAQAFFGDNFDVWLGEGPNMQTRIPSGALVAVRSGSRKRLFLAMQTVGLAQFRTPYSVGDVTVSLSADAQTISVRGEQEAGKGTVTVRLHNARLQHGKFAHYNAALRVRLPAARPADSLSCAPLQVGTLFPTTRPLFTDGGRDAGVAAHIVCFATPGLFFVVDCTADALDRSRTKIIGVTRVAGRSVRVREFGIDHSMLPVELGAAPEWTLLANGSELLLDGEQVTVGIERLWVLITGPTRYLTVPSAKRRATCRGDAAYSNGQMLVGMPDLRFVSSLFDEGWKIDRRQYRCPAATRT